MLSLQIHFFKQNHTLVYIKKALFSVKNADLYINIQLYNCCAYFVFRLNVKLVDPGRFSGFLSLNSHHLHLFVFSKLGF